MALDTVIFYSTPAFGHVSASFEIVRQYVQRGYQVYYYSTSQFENAINLTGAIFREYKFDPDRLDLTVGSKLLRLEDTIITFANELTPDLIMEAIDLKPKMILHDNVAMWGRIVGKELVVPTISVNTFPVVPSMISKAGLLYTKNFGGLMIKDISVIPHLNKEKKKLKKRFPKIKLSMLDSILNPEKLNLITFPGELQPGMRFMKKRYYALGSSALNLDKYFGGEIIDTKSPTIFVSLGTVFQNNQEFYKTVVNSFKNTKYNLVIAMSDKNREEVFGDEALPENIRISPFVSQGKLLDNSDLFISAGGMNSICQAVHRRVPCLMCPQEGEQQITCRAVEKMGLGKILNKGEDIFALAEKLISEYDSGNSNLALFEEPDYDKLFEVIDDYIKG